MPPSAHGRIARRLELWTAAPSASKQDEMTRSGCADPSRRASVRVAPPIGASASSAPGRRAVELSARLAGPPRRRSIFNTACSRTAPS